MPIKLTEFSTGIYRTIKHEVNWELGPELTAKLGLIKEDIEALRRLYLDKDFDICAQLDGLEAGAERIIKDNGGFAGLRKNERGGGEWFPLPSDAPVVMERARGLLEKYKDASIPRRDRSLIAKFRQYVILDRARRLIFEVWSVRDGLKKLEEHSPRMAVQVRNIAFNAYRLGRWTEVVGISPFEKDADSGRRGRRGAGKGRSGQRIDDYLKERYQKAFDRNLRLHPDWSTNALGKKTAGEFPSPLDRIEGLSYRTILRHIKDPRKK